jgi:hypothetical protein
VAVHRGRYEKKGKENQHRWLWPHKVQLVSAVAIVVVLEGAGLAMNLLQVFVFRAAVYVALLC